MGIGLFVFGCVVSETRHESKVSGEQELSDEEDGEMREFPNKSRFIKRQKHGQFEKMKKVAQVVRTDLQVEQKGEDFILQYTLENVSGDDLLVTFPSGQEFDFFVYNQNNELVYRWSDGKMFIMAIHETVLPAEEQIQIQEVWDGRDKNGKVVPPGEYRINFVLTAKVETAEQMAISEKELVATTTVRMKK